MSYSESRCVDRKVITSNIIRVLQTNGRFLRLINNKWVLVSDREIRQKIAHAILYRNRATLPKQDSITQPATTDVGTTVALELVSTITSTQMPQAFTPNQQSHYNDSDTSRTGDLNQQTVMPQYPFRNDNINNERQWQPFNLPQNNFATTHHHGAVSNTMLQLPPTSNSCFVVPIEASMDQTKQGVSKHPIANSCDAGMQHHHRRFITDSSQKRRDSASTSDHKLPSLSNSGNQILEPPFPCNIPATSTTFDSLDVSLTSIHETITTPDSGTLLNVFDHGFPGSNILPSNVKQPPAAIQYENGSMRRDMARPENVAHNNESTIGPLLSPLKVHGYSGPTSSGMYAPDFFPLPLSLIIPDGTRDPVQPPPPKQLPYTRRMDDADTIVTTIRTDTISVPSPTTSLRRATSDVSRDSFSSVN